MKIYCMADIHGYIKEFEYALSLIDLSKPDTMLMLLGDYVHGPDDLAVLDKIIDLQDELGRDKVVTLMGNHEEMVLDGSFPLVGSGKRSANNYKAWMRKLPRYYATERQIFCHAGIDEEAGDFWQWGTNDDMFLWKCPAQTGSFYMDIVAGHIGTSSIAGNRSFHNIFYDGQSHYYIDGTVQVSKAIPVLMVDTERNKYYRITESGPWPILPYHEEY